MHLPEGEDWLISWCPPFSRALLWSLLLYHPYLVLQFCCGTSTVPVGLPIPALHWRAKSLQEKCCVKSTTLQKLKLARRYKRTKPARGILGKREYNYLSWNLARQQGLMQKPEGFHPVRSSERAFGTGGGQGLCVMFHSIPAIPANTVAPLLKH